MIGRRIKQARQSTGLSLRDLAEKAGVSAMAISKYERDESTPSSPVLLALSQALGVRVEYFFRQIEVELEAVEYRKHSKLPAKIEHLVLGEVRDRIERWLALEEFLPTPWSVEFKIPESVPPRIKSPDDVEQAAYAVREAWNLGLNPISDLVDTLESHGIKAFIVHTDVDGKFDGLSAKVNGMPVVAVSAHRPGDRQRFTLAHEFGHLILDGRLAKGLDLEKACHRFAGALLVPRSSVIAALGERRTWLEPLELQSLKQEWGLSMAGWMFRARDLGILPQARFQGMWAFFRSHGWDQREPDPQYPNEQTRLFEQRLYHALAEDLISEAKAAELLGMTLAQLHACRRMECDGADRQ